MYKGIKRSCTWLLLHILYHKNNADELGLIQNANCHNMMFAAGVTNYLPSSLTSEKLV